MCVASIAEASVASEILDQPLDVWASCADSAALEDHLGMTMSVGAILCVLVHSAPHVQCLWFTNTHGPNGGQRVLKET